MSSNRSASGCNAPRLKSRTKEKGKGSVPGSRKTGLELARAAPGTTVTCDDDETSLEEDMSEWPWVTLADSSSSSRPVVFTADGNYFFSVIGSAVRIYSVATKKIVSTLSSSPIGSSASRVANGEGHSDIITSVILDPEDPFQLVTASLDGDIKVWNFLDAILVRTIRIGHPISHMCAHDKWKGKVFVAVLTKEKKNGLLPLGKGNTMIYRVSLTPKQSTSSESAKSSEVVRLGKTKAAISMGISPSGSWLVVVAGHKAYVSATSSSQSGFTKFVSPEKLTCLAFHPAEDYFATGDELGQIRFWYCLNEQPASSAAGERRAQTTTMHWHAHAVSSLAFTRNGAYLLSGGEESVLVIWQLQTGRKEFVPRLGSPISTIAIRTRPADEEEYLLGLADGGYLFVSSSSLNICRSIPRVRLDPRGAGREAHMPLPLAVHRRSSTLVLPASHPSSLQLYSPDTSALSELEVSPSNRISRRDEKEIEATRVDFVKVSSSGDWMATIDARDNDEEFSAELNLKLWQWDGSAWVLNTRIDRPHGFERIVAMDFLPHTKENEELLVTVGFDGNVKTWCIRSITAKGGLIEDIWTSRSSINFRDALPTDGRWSPDGSLFAVSFGRQVVLYNPNSNLLLDCLTTMDIRIIESIRFLGRNGRYILATGRNNAVLWDLVTRTVRWHFYTPFTIAHALAHPTEEFAALIIQPFVEDVALKASRILHFTPMSSRPFTVRTLPFRFRVVDWFGLDNMSRSLIGVTYSWNIVVCGDDLLSFSGIGEAPRVLDKASDVPLKKTLFQDIFGESAFLDASLEPTAPALSSYATGKKQDVGSLFDVPAYSAPPLESLYPSLMMSFLNKSPESVVPPVVEEQDDADDMAVDNEPIQAPVDTRNVGQTEVDGLIDLFRRHIIDKEPGPVDRSNGVANGTPKSRLNGIASSTAGSQISLTPKSPGAKLKSAQDAKNSNMLPKTSVMEPITTGKKRKKSIS